MNTLKLNVGSKCKGGPCRCTDGSTGNFATERKTDIPNVTGFVSYTHELSGGGTFTLNGHLHGGDQLGDGGQNIPGVEKVSVYYWDEDDGKNDAKPLILEVEISDGGKKYYYKHDKDEREISGSNETIWKHYGYSGGLSLQDRLDDRNCAINGRIPLDIEYPTKYRNFESNVSKGKGIKFHSFTPLPGSDYTVTSYSIVSDSVGFEFKLSRVEYGKEKITEIKVPTSALDGIRLYSSPVSTKVPLVIELAEVGGGNSTFYASKGERGGWSNVEAKDSKGFYDDKDFSTKRPKEVLNNKLDDVACFYRNAVTIDLTKSNSTTHTNNGQYCCEKCNTKVSVEEIQVHHETHQKHVTIYKHSINGGQLSGIKFYLNDDLPKENRKRIAPRKLRLPIQGPVDVYAFHCNHNPSLIYVDSSRSTKPQATGWYRKSRRGYDKSWTKLNRQLKGITPSNFKDNIDCGTWKTLKNVLYQRGCTLDDCPPGSPGLSPSIQEESEEASDDDRFDNVVDLGISVSTEVENFWWKTLDTVIKSALPEFLDLVNKSMKSTVTTSAAPAGSSLPPGSNNLLNGLLDLGINISDLAKKFGMQTNQMLKEVVERTRKLAEKTAPGLWAVLSLTEDGEVQVQNQGEDIYLEDSDNEDTYRQDSDDPSDGFQEPLPEDPAAKPDVPVASTPGRDTNGDDLDPVKLISQSEVKPSVALKTPEDGNSGGGAKDDGESESDDNKGAGNETPKNQVEGAGGLGSGTGSAASTATEPTAGRDPRTEAEELKDETDDSSSDKEPASGAQGHAGGLPGPAGKVDGVQDPNDASQPPAPTEPSTTATEDTALSTKAPAPPGHEVSHGEAVSGPNGDSGGGATGANNTQGVTVSEALARSVSASGRKYSQTNSSTNDWKVNPSTCVLATTNDTLDIKRVNQIISSCNVTCTNHAYMAARDYLSHAEETNVSTVLEFLIGGEDSLRNHVKELSLKLGLQSFLQIINSFKFLNKKVYKNKFSLSTYSMDNYLSMDRAAFLSLAILPNTKSGSSTSLYSILNKCRTSIGSQLLKIWISQPLTDPEEIKRRHDCVEAFKEGLYRVIQAECLRKVPDLDSILIKFRNYEMTDDEATSGLEGASGRIGIYGAGREERLRSHASRDDRGKSKPTFEDLVLLYDCIVAVNRMVQFVLKPYDGLNSPTVHLMFTEPLLKISTMFETYLRLVEKTVDLKEAEKRNYVINRNFDPALTKLANDLDNTRNEMERLRSAIEDELVLNNYKKKGGAIKIVECNTMGFLFRVSKKDQIAVQNAEIPGITIEKVRLNKNEFLFTTSKLRKLCTKFKTISGKYQESQLMLVTKTFRVAATYWVLVEGLLKTLASLDVLTAFAEVAAIYDYVRPEIDPEGKEIKLLQARHPLVEHVLSSKRFVANDLEMDREVSRIHITTGPNMGGKSTYIKQVRMVHGIQNVNYPTECVALKEDKSRRMRD
ncbi:hypothetical protein BEWA_029560 [Theileria equi strain WA]|uniref:DNA mismatch repair protein MutS core domain-containing protein n=1 Tax=Theileria equi strain WA TaxID=1537102 RepID=L0AYL1_THEEQ|nr:hypothetical protein BEWA_029560 [Theileria equi strain WA]AFZ80106.1 hypothetical protein BEWA_029560 [Theileria equi strain WA]|eukprot:XP_004829772.1 hypothetical protein BEWA_029560 [Theileria equi strain WA]